MKRFTTKPTQTINQHNQKTTVGYIYLDKPCQLSNTVNEGISPLDTFKYNVKNSVANLKAGTKVKLTIQEMVTGTSYKISYTDSEFTYTATKVVR